MTTRLLLLSVDGLSWQQLSRLRQLLPSGTGLFAEGSMASLETSPFSESQPIWAQILSGKPWYENGCTGYARPTTSLNKLEVFDESALSVPVDLIANSQNSLAVNVPLLRPRERLWLADGSLPSLLTVSPEALNRYFENRYKPRPYGSLASGLSERFASAGQIVKTETERLTATARILKEHGWREAIVRITAFDQLHHLFGLGCFDDVELLAHQVVCDLLNAVDQFLATILELDCRFACLSAFSHAPCRSRFNVNALLRRSGYLNLRQEVADASGDTDKRLEAVASMAGAPAAMATLCSIAGRLSPAHSLAASPVSGCVYINSSRHFNDGTVSDTETKNVAESLANLLHGRLNYYFGARASLHEVPTHACASISLPHFILSVPSIEFFDSNETVLDIHDKPAVCHRAEGFFYMRQTSFQQKPVTPVQTNQLLKELGFGQR